MADKSVSMEVICLAGNPSAVVKLTNCFPSYRNSPPSVPSHSAPSSPIDALYLFRRQAVERCQTPPRSFADGRKLKIDVFMHLSILNGKHVGIGRGFRRYSSLCAKVCKSIVQMASDPIPSRLEIDETVSSETVTLCRQPLFFLEFPGIRFLRWARLSIRTQAFGNGFPWASVTRPKHTIGIDRLLVVGRVSDVHWASRCIFPWNPWGERSRASPASKFHSPNRSRSFPVSRRCIFC